jgi:CelD/BcsL family acetyltransferase involved in cellulose biosynthesis
MLAALNAAAPAAAPLRPLQFERIGDVSALQAAKPEWDSLFARIGDARLGFQTNLWATTWARHYAAPGDLNILTGRSNGRLAFLWPLRARRLLGATVLEALGDPLSQYHSALIDPELDAESATAAAIAALRGQGADLLALRRVRADLPLADALVARGAEVRHVEQAPFVDLIGGKVARAVSEKGKEAANRRRRLRRLEELGPVRFEIATCPKIAAARVAEAMAMKRGWALKTGRLARAPFDPRFERAFQAALLARDPQARLRVTSLTCGDRPVGIDIAIASRSRLFGHVLAHDPELSSLGVGSLLADASIREASAEGYQTFDLLAPADDYKRAWADGEVDVLDLQLPLSLRGQWLAQAWNGANLGLRWLAPRAPLALRRAALSHFRR